MGKYTYQVALAARIFMIPIQAITYWIWETQMLLKKFARQRLRFPVCQSGL